MRHHDIERLKQAASRYRADATCLCDVEELVDYAIDKLDAEHAPVTWTPPASLPDGEYEWDGLFLSPICRAWSASKTATIPMLFADFTDPPRKGRYRKDGAISTWIGE